MSANKLGRAWGGGEGKRDMDSGTNYGSPIGRAEGSINDYMDKAKESRTLYAAIMRHTSFICRVMRSRPFETIMKVEVVDVALEKTYDSGKGRCSPLSSSRVEIYVETKHSSEKGR